MSDLICHIFNHKCVVVAHDIEKVLCAETPSEPMASHIDLDEEDERKVNGDLDTR